MELVQQIDSQCFCCLFLFDFHSMMFCLYLILTVIIGSSNAVQEGTSFVFHTDGVNLKTPATGGKKVIPTTANDKVKPIPAYAQRPSHWAVNRSPGMRMDGPEHVAVTGWSALFVSSGGTPKEYRVANIKILLGLVVYVLVTAALAQFLPNFNMMNAFNEL